MSVTKAAREATERRNDEATQGRSGNGAEPGPTASPPTARGVLRDIELDWLIPTPRNPRGPVDEKSAEFAELVASVRANGVLQNLVARPLPAALVDAAARYQKSLGPVKPGEARAWPDPAAMFEVCCGARRLAAARAAGLASVTVLVCQLDDKQAMEITFVENFARQNLRPLQEARGVQAMLDVGWPIEAVAERIGRTPAWVAKRARLLQLSNSWQAALTDEKLPFHVWPAGVLETIARLAPAAQDATLAELKNNTDYADELRDLIGFDGPVPTVAEFEKWLAAEVLHTLGGAPFDPADETLLPRAGACTNCPKRASHERLLFEGLLPAGEKYVPIAKDRCLDAACYGQKVTIALKRSVETARSRHGRALTVIEGGLDYGRTQDLLRMFPGTAEAYQIREVAADTRGAVPAVVVGSGKPGRVGKTIWVAGPNGSAAPAGGKTKAAKKEPGKPTPLAERRKQLDSRRRALALQKFRDALAAHGAAVEKLKTAGVVEMDDALCGPAAWIVALAVVFGTQLKHDSGHDWEKRWPQCQALALGNAGAFLQRGVRQLTAAVIPVLLARLTPHDLAGAERLYPFAGKVAGLFKIDLSKFWGEAVVEIPEPASWAREEEATKRRSRGSTKGKKQLAQRKAVRA